jgi:hypothetical protein
MMDWKGFDRKRSWSNFKVLIRHSPGGTEENHEIHHDGRSRGPWIEPGTFLVRSRSVDHSATTFGLLARYVSALTGQMTTGLSVHVLDVGPAFSSRMVRTTMFLWVVDSCRYRRFGETYSLRLQGLKWWWEVETYLPFPPPPLAQFLSP